MIASESPRTFLPAIAIALLLGVSTVQGGRVWEQGDGIVAGRWIFLPAIEFDMGADSNIFRNSINQDPADAYFTSGAELEVMLPFGAESAFEFQWQGDQSDFANNQFANGVATDAELGVELNFKSGEELQISDRFVRDFIQVRNTNIGDVGPGGDAEEPFFGRPFHRNRLEVRLERSDPRHQGYLIRVRREDFVYQGQSTVDLDTFDPSSVGLYDYRGFDGTFEYRQPFAQNRSLVVHYSMRRFNHYRANAPEELGLEGIPFRKEISDTFQAGVSGNLGRNQPFLIRLGYGSFRYEGQEGSDYRGINGFARWRLSAGGRTVVNLSASREPLPSNFRTFYISDRIRAIAEKLFATDTKFGFIGGVTNNEYQDLVPDFELNCGGIRHDFIWDVGARWAWDVHRMVRIRGNLVHTQRISNCEDVEYVSNAIDVGIVLGWF